MITRYDTYGLDWKCETYADEKGPLVAYEDYQKLESEIKELRQQLGAVKPEADEGWVEWRGGEQPEADEGWVEWRGGEQPVADDVIVKVTCRGGDRFGPLSASHFEWEHYVPGPGDYDIVAYRIVN